jgi:hypothetical protein
MSPLVYRKTLGGHPLYNSVRNTVIFFRKMVLWLCAQVW